MVASRKRIRAIDALRGLDMVWLVGLESIVVALAAAWPNAVTKELANQMTHTSVGLHLYDLIFPTFVFLAGCSWVFSLSSQLGKGLSRGRILFRIMKRFALLFVLGAVLFGLPSFDLAHVRLNSVLGRIGLGWGVAAATMLFAPRKWWIFGVVFFVCYWVVQQFAPAWVDPSADPWSLSGGSMMDLVDKWIGKPAPDQYGSEGFFASLGCIPSAFLGLLAGSILAKAEWSSRKKSIWLLLSALVLGAVGAVAAQVCPCMKPMWNPTYILFSGSIAMGLLALFYWVIDVRGAVAWSFPLRVIGMNALAVYVLGYFLSFRPGVHKLLCGVERFLPPIWTPVLDCCGTLAVVWLLLYFLYRKETFIRL